MLNASKGYLTSPHYPAVYPTGQECTWLIRVQSGYTVQITLSSFDLGSTARSCSDPPPIYEGYLSVSWFILL